MYETISSSFDRVFDTMYVINPFLAGFAFILIIALSIGTLVYIAIKVCELLDIWVNHFK